MNYLAVEKLEGLSCLLYISEKQKEFKKKELKEATYVALTTNIWTSCQTKGYIRVTAHYISPEWVLQSAVLETVCIAGSHMAENIAQHLTHRVRVTAQTGEHASASHSSGCRNFII